MKLKLYFITLLAFLAIDSLWLGFVAPSFYRSQIGYIMAENPNLIVAGLFYLLFVFGMVIFVVEPGVREGNLSRAVLRGALFGLVTYATYDLTNRLKISTSSFPTKPHIPFFLNLKGLRQTKSMSTDAPRVFLSKFNKN